MLLSYNFLVYYSLTSALFLIKDIFLKGHCNTEYSDEIIIANYKKAFPIVFRNALFVLKILAIYDLYLIIFGCDYSILWTTIYLWLGYYMCLFSYNVISDLNHFTLDESRNNLMEKDGVTVRSPFFILYVDPIKFESVLKPLAILSWFMLINEYVVMYYIFATYWMLVLDVSNTNCKPLLDIKETLEIYKTGIYSLNNSKIVKRVVNLTNNVLNRMKSRKVNYSDEYVNIVKTDGSNTPKVDRGIDDNIEYVMSTNPNVVSEIEDATNGVTLEPVAEPVTEPVAEPVPEPVAEPVPDAVAEPVPDAVAEPVTEPVAEPVVEPVAEPVPDAGAEPVTEPVSEPVVEPVAEPVEQSSSVQTAEVTNETDTDSGVTA